MSGALDQHAKEIFAELGDTTAKQDVLETETTIAKWPKGSNWIQLKYLTGAAGMTPEIRDRLETRIKKLAEYDALKATEAKLTGSKENAVLEQRRIKGLMSASAARITFQR